ncbi:sporulation protein YqfD [bacterium LRH843]|nr:sporulation protein YqfD [bacterium LRH843]
MKNNWTNLINGYVRVQIDGEYPERFLNRCIEEHISIWDIKRIGDERIVCYMDIEDVKRIRPLLRLTRCKVNFTTRRGLPFILKRMMKRSGFVAGLLCFFCVLFMLSNMVWNIDVRGASPKVEHELRQIVKQMGIKKGALQFLLPSVELIQRDVTEMITGATWVGVRQKGTTYEFEVVEQQLPEEAERFSPRNLVATKKAIIYDIFVEHGEAQVKPNDFVREGDVLVSGFIGKEGRKILVPAVATVLGEIWYKSEASVPLNTLFTSLTGERVSRHYVRVNEWDLPIWGFGKNEFQTFQQFEHETPLKFFKWTLPITYKKRDLFETSQFKRTYTKKEAVLAAQNRARVDLIKHLPADARIIGEKVLHEAVENGKVNLQIHYQVIEDITSEQPIIQGD